MAVTARQMSLCPRMVALSTISLQNLTHHAPSTSAIDPPSNLHSKDFYYQSLELYLVVFTTSTCSRYLLLHSLKFPIHSHFIFLHHGFLHCSSILRYTIQRAKPGHKAPFLFYSPQSRSRSFLDQFSGSRHLGDFSSGSTSKGAECRW